MSQQQLVVQQEHKKLWQIMDESIDKYVQAKLRLAYEDKRCVIGAILTEYHSIADIYGQDSPEVFKNVFDKHLIKKARMEQSLYVFKLDDKQLVIEAMKDMYKKEGYILTTHLFTLNDQYGVTFAEFRDLFKEMGI